MKLAFFKHVGVSSLAAGWVTSHTGSQIPKLLLQLPNENEVGRGKPGQANPLEISKWHFCSPFLQTTLFFLDMGMGFQMKTPIIHYGFKTFGRIFVQKVGARDSQFNLRMFFNWVAQPS